MAHPALTRAFLQAAATAAMHCQPEQSLHCRHLTWNLEMMSLSSMSENTTNKDDTCGKPWWWTKTKSPRWKWQIDCHHCASHRAVNQCCVPTFFPKAKSCRRQQNQNPSNKKTRRNQAVFVLRCEPFCSVFMESSVLFFFCVNTIADSASIGFREERVIFDTTYLWLEASYQHGIKSNVQLRLVDKTYPRMKKNFSGPW